MNLADARGRMLAYAAPVKRSLLCGLLMFHVPWLTLAQESDKAAPAAAPAPPDSWVKQEPITGRLERLTDRFGNRWGLDSRGRITLSNANVPNPEIQALDGPALLVNSADFVPEEIHRGPQGRWRLHQKIGALEITRWVWIDPRRGGARYVESLHNTSDEPQKAHLQLTTLLQEDVSELRQLSGAPWTGQPGGDSGPAGAAVLRKDPAVRAGLLFLLAAQGGVAPVYEPTRDTSPSVVWGWQLEVPAGRTVSVLHWVVQRSELVADQLPTALEPFWKQQRLVQPEIPPGLAETIVNFPEAGAGDEGGGGENAILQALLQLCERMGIQRGASDLYWMSANSILQGRVEGGPLTVESRFGVREIALEEVAAVQGGGGRGRVPRVFLRDGTVLTGPLNLPDWKVVGERGWTIKVTPEALETVVMRKQPPPGNPPEFMAALTSGEVLPFSLEGEVRLSLSSPWGPVGAPLRQVSAYFHLREPALGCRLWLADGSRLSVFPGHGEFTVSSRLFGAVPLSVPELSALWQPARSAPQPDMEMDEIDSLEGLEGSFCLLRGGNLLAGRISSPELSLLTGNTEAVLGTSEVQALVRTEEGADTVPRFRLQLASGATLEGVLRMPAVRLTTSVGDWEVPVAHLVAFRESTAPAGAAGPPPGGEDRAEDGAEEEPEAAAPTGAAEAADAQ